MGKLYNFVSEELEFCLADKINEEKEIHLFNIKTKLIENKIKDLESNIDKTETVFSFQGNNKSFDLKEIEKLKEEKLQYENVINNKIIRLNNLNERIEKIKSILKEEDEERINYIKSNTKYNSYDVLYLQETDRQRIARDIHDSVIQGLAVLIHKNEFIDKIMESDYNRAHLELKNCSKIIRENIDELRNIIFNLRPMSLDDLGFENSFNSFIDKLKKRTDMLIKSEFNCTSNIDPVIGISILRILSELSSNSVKYSEGTIINIKIYNDKENIFIIFSDNGKGYDFNYDIHLTSNNTGFGLVNIKDRVNLLEGECEISYDNHILEYRITIPEKNVIDKNTSV